MPRSASHHSASWAAVAVRRIVHVWDMAMWRVDALVERVTHREMIDTLVWRCARSEGIPPAVVRLSVGLPL